MEKVFSLWKDLKWYGQILVLLVLLGPLIYFFKGNNLLIVSIGVALTFNILWQVIFCRAIIKNNQVYFNLSIFAELILMLWYLALAGLIGNAIFTMSSSWYAYIIPVLFLLANLTKVLEIFGNRRDFIRISGSTLTWKDGEKTGELELKSYFFEDRKTEAFELKVSGEATGPFLIVVDGENKEHSFDLKTMNLGGHYYAMEKYLSSHFKEITTNDEINI
jgi:hypothetical protein